MSQPVYRLGSLLEQTLPSAPVGTNLGLAQTLFALMSGRFLTTRGALFPALQAIGLSPEAVRRACAALRDGRFETADLLASWQRAVRAEGHFVPHHFGG